jgi:hypothetical protein
VADRRGHPTNQKKNRIMNKKLILAGLGAAIALATSACGNSQAAVPTPHSIDIHADGGNFLPAYLDWLRAGVPPKDNACDPKTLADLLGAPCDKPVHP